MAARRLSIATLQEGPLHAALKDWYRQPGDRLEVPVAGKQIDLVRGKLLIEIQTSSVAKIRKKLEQLAQDQPLRLVLPVVLRRWIIRLDEDGEVLGRRRSPFRGRLEDGFEELVSVAQLFAEAAFSIDLLLIHEDEVRSYEPERTRRRKGWRVVERRLIEVVDRRLLREPVELLELLPPGLPTPFTTADMARGLDIPRDLAQRMAYFLREAGAVVRSGKQGNSICYTPALAAHESPAP